MQTVAIAIQQIRFIHWLVHRIDSGFRIGVFRIRVATRFADKSRHLRQHIRHGDELRDIKRFIIRARGRQRWIASQRLRQSPLQRFRLRRKTKTCEADGNGRNCYERLFFCSHN